MATFGKSIRIYLKDGTVTGIKLGEVVNQTIQSISCPRLKTSELNELSEAKRPGVYFLFGQDEETGDIKAYIGEAENFYNRIQDHIVNKPFWNELIVFVSKDDNLTKSHVKYLESRLIQIAISTNRYKIENANQPQKPTLPQADRDAMEEFLTYIKLLIGVLGHKLLENATAIARRENESYLLTGSTSENPISQMTSSLELFLSVNNLKARAIQTDEGIVVLEGSEAIKDTKPSMSNGYKVLRDKLINNGSLVLEENKYIFKKDVLFVTATPAAAIIVGTSVTGLQMWKNKAGKTLKEIEQERVILVTPNNEITTVD